ncbi:hypothetical protein R3I93_003261 [Phoxinus phoxinus]|uniref:Uncharacterized protein n=1 Tax=Phoxinus phoxinus TaxID=58324 RepID=A0AAN9DHP7_9TELE
MPQYQLQVCHDEIIEGKYYFIIETGSSCNSKKNILDDLLRQRPGLKEVCSVGDSHVILVFCTISSRAGTDIDAALHKLDSFSDSKPAIFIVLHHTFDPEKTIPDSSRYVTREKTLTVDCLFHEDSGLLKCNRNDESLTKIVQRFKHQGQSDVGLPFTSILQWIYSRMRYCVSVVAAMWNCVRCYFRRPDRKRQTE